MARFSSVAFGFVVVVLLQCAAAQTVHVVGDNLGWGILTGGAQAYTDWANGKSFVVGDVLSKYLPHLTLAKFAPSCFFNYFTK